MLEREESYSAVHLVITFHIIDLVILCERVFECRLQIIIRAVSYTKYIDSVSLKTVAEIPVRVWEIR